MSLIKPMTKFAQDTMHNILSNLCNQIDQACKSNATNRIPYGFVACQVAGMKQVCPWLNRNNTMNEYRRRIKKSPPTLLLECMPTEPSSESVAEGTVTIYTGKKNGGRPIGTTKKRRKLSELSLYAAKNEITESIRESRDEGLSMKEKLAKMKQITAGQLFKAKGCRIGKDIFDIYMANVEANKKERDEAMRKEQEHNVKWQ